MVNRRLAIDLESLFNGVLTAGLVVALPIAGLYEIARVVRQASTLDARTKIVQKADNYSPIAKYTP